MKFHELLAKVRGLATFDTGFLLAGQTQPASLRVQLARWVKTGKLISLRRGLYTLAHPYREREPHAFAVANAIFPGSYVSLQAALAHWGHLPESTFAVTTVGLGRGERIETPMGSFLHRHVTASLLFGFEEIDLGKGERARVAWPEKALLDLVHLTPRGDTLPFLRALRLQFLSDMDEGRFRGLLRRRNRPKWQRAVEAILFLRDEELADSEGGAPR